MRRSDFVIIVVCSSWTMLAVAAYANFCHAVSIANYGLSL